MMGGRGSGGKRDNAGRRAKLPEIYDPEDGEFLTTRLWVGQQCEILWREECAAKREAHIEKLTVNYRALFREAGESVRLSMQDAVKRILATDQGEALAREYGAKEARRMALQIWNSSDVGGDHFDRVAEAVVKDASALSHGQSLSDQHHEQYGHLLGGSDRGGWLLSVNIAKPQGVRPTILKEVRQRVRDRFNAVMSLDWISECWKEYRALEKRLAAERDISDF